MGWLLMVMTAGGKVAGSADSILPGDFVESAEIMVQTGLGQVNRFTPQAGEPARLAVAVTNVPPAPWHVQAKCRLSQPVRAGDVLLLSLDLQAEEADPATGEAAVQICLQQAQEPFRVEAEAVVIASPNWTRHVIPLRTQRAYPADGLQVALNFGVCRQRVLLRHVSARNLGPRKSIAGLRHPPITYAGRETNAPWRKPAAERIERFRKGNLTLQVRDARGQPVAGAQVTLRLRRHAFAFGTAVTAARLLGESEDDHRYRQVLLKYFNTAVFENDMKWPMWEHPDAQRRLSHRRSTLAAAKWLRDHGFAIRGHCLLWPELSRLPADVAELARRGDAVALRGRIDNHIRGIVGQFTGIVDEWDVVNEPLSHQALQQVLGADALADWFRTARAADPHARLFLNDFALLSYGALNSGKIERLYQTLCALRESGAPIDAIGEQGHFADIPVSPPRMIELLNRFADIGLPIRITEFDIAAEDQQLQADYLRDFFTAAFSHPSVDGIVLWGFFQKNHWKPQAALWDARWNLRPVGEAFVELVGRQWTTAVAGQTDASGRFEFRGFKGAYEGTVSAGTATVRIAPVLPGSGVLEVRLPE
ncbi:MAG: endo-1,4-beta-xylanase [Phycisphaerae bacterium]|nr:endo-1,4-beta-xylanase [Phycisphaerae bacterium]MDW8261207.1 endo-1,4-beta-xylanase [Phycisphaerales bacterium]